MKTFGINLPCDRTGHPNRCGIEHAAPLEKIRRITFERASDDEPLDFYPVARELGLNDKDAERATEILTERVMRGRGAI